MRPAPYLSSGLLALALCAALAASAAQGQGKPPVPALASTNAPTAPLPPEDDSPAGKAYRDAFVAYKQGLYAQADAACDKAVKLAPKDPRPAVLKGRIAAAKGDALAAEPLLRQGLALDPASHASRRALGEFLFHQRRYKEGRLELLEAQRLGDADKDLALLILYCDVGAGDLGEAERAFPAFNAFDERTPAYYFAKSAVLELKKDEAGAKQALQDATVMYGTDVFARYARDYFFLFATKG